MTRGISPWRALAQSGISLKWEDPCPSGRGVCQPSQMSTLGSDISLPSIANCLCTNLTHVFLSSAPCLAQKDVLSIDLSFSLLTIDDGRDSRRNRRPSGLRSVFPIDNTHERADTRLVRI